MNFAEILEHYLAMLGCTSQMLSEASGVSPATISRYSSGSNTPKPGSRNLEKLAAGIAGLAKEKGLDVTEENVLRRRNRPGPVWVLVILMR